MCSPVVALSQPLNDPFCGSPCVPPMAPPPVSYLFWKRLSCRVRVRVRVRVLPLLGAPVLQGAIEPERGSEGEFREG